MGTLDTASLLADMLTAARGVLREKWPEVRGYAEAESEKILERIAEIQRLHLAGRITETQARLLVDMQKDAAQAVLLATEIMSLAAAEQAINAALAAVRDTVNTAVGFVLL